jgi:hypothetical protein
LNSNGADKLAHCIPNGPSISSDQISYFDLESFQKAGIKPKDFPAEVLIYRSLYLKNTLYNEKIDEKDANGISSELVRRYDALGSIINKLESNCIDLHSEMQIVMSCSHCDLVPKVSIIQSNYFEGIWTLESSINDVKYEYDLLKRYALFYDTLNLVVYI